MEKLKMTWRSSRAPIGAMFVGILALLLLGGRGVKAESARSDGESEEVRGHNPNPALFPPESHPFGFGMDTWAENW